MPSRLNFPCKAHCNRRLKPHLESTAIIWLATAALLLSLYGAIANSELDDIICMTAALCILASLFSTRMVCFGDVFRHAVTKASAVCLTMLGFWMLASVSCKTTAYARTGWGGVIVAGSAAVLHFAQQANPTQRMLFGGFIFFQFVGLLVGVLTISTCKASRTTTPLLSWAACACAITIATCSWHQMRHNSNTHSQSVQHERATEHGTISLLNAAVEILTQSLVAVPVKVATKLQEAKQLLYDAKISAKADVLLMAAAATTSSRFTDTTTSVPTAHRSNRNLLDKETTRWLTTELQAASTRSFVRMGTKLRDGIKATRAHRTELLRTNSDHSNSATKLSTLEGAGGQLAAMSSSKSSMPTPPGRTLTNCQIRQTLSRVTLRQTASVVSMLNQSGMDLLGRNRRGSSGSAEFATPPPFTTGKTMELGELADMVSEDGLDSSDAASVSDFGNTFSSDSKCKASMKQRLLAARSFYQAPGAENITTKVMVRTFSQPGSMRKLLSSGGSSESTSSDGLLTFLKHTYESDDEYTRTRTLLYRKGSAFSGLPIPSNLHFVIAYSGMDTWKFNVFRAGAQCGARPLACVTSVALEGMGLLQVLRVKRKVFSAFIMYIEKTYCHDPILPNPYHNSFHAADVVQATHQFLLSPRVNGVLTDFNATACLIAAAAHDYRHPGVNNTFLVKTSNELAIVYSDMAVLEHFHSAETFKVFNDPSMNILSGLGEGERRSMRASIIQCILATDLADGRKYTQQFADRADMIEKDQLSSDHMTLMQMCLKCADVCHAARPLTVHEKWSLLVTLEFHQQGDVEHNMGVPISPLCDRDSFNMARSQLGFVDFVVRPCLEPFAEWCGNSEWTDCLTANELHWFNMRALEDVAASESKRSATMAEQPHAVAVTMQTLADAPVKQQAETHFSNEAVAVSISADASGQQAPSE